MPVAQATLRVAHVVTAITATGVIPVEVVVFVHLHPRKKQHNKDLHNAWQQQKKEANAVEMHRPEVDIAGNIINSKADGFLKTTTLFYNL
jgi:hypothetical protein